MCVLPVSHRMARNSDPNKIIQIQCHIKLTVIFLLSMYHQYLYISKCDNVLGKYKQRTTSILINNIFIRTYYYKIFYSNTFTIKGLVHIHSMHSCSYKLK